MAVRRKRDTADAGLEALRAEVDECDKQIIRLLSRRFELVREIGRHKAINNLPVRDEAREAQLLSDRKRQAPDVPVDKIFQSILEQSRRIQAEVREEMAGKSTDDQNGRAKAGNIK